MLPGGKNMKDLMKQAQKMQQEMLKSQQALEEQVFEATAGGGMVKVQMNGRNEIISLKIDPQAVDPEDVEMLEDLIVAAFQEVQKKVADASSDAMGKLTGGMKIPGLF